MIDEARAVELLAGVNPVPDLESYETTEADVAAQLAILHERSNEMTQLNTRTSPSTASKPRRRLVLVGGLVAALALIVTFITLTGDSANDAADGGLVSADFVGTWTVPQEGVSSLFLYFDEDGRYAASNSFGSFEEYIIETGDWSYDGNELVFDTDDGSTSCAGTVGRYEAQRVDDLRIRLTTTEPDSCVIRQQGIGLGAMLSYPYDPEFADK